MRKESLWKQAKRGWLLALGLSAIPALAQVSASAIATPPEAAGRAVLLIEDFRMLVGIKSREISSQGDAAPTALLGSRPMHLNLSEAEVRRIKSRLAKVESDRCKLAAKLQKRAEARKSELRQGRRSVQLARMKTPDSDDARLGRSLFESLLEESNLEAEAAQALEAFDADNRVELSYVERDGIRIVQTIEIGSQSVWRLRDSSGLAKR